MVDSKKNLVLNKKDQERNLSMIKKQIATTTTIPEKYVLKDK